ncbi:DHH family phosphoesterase [Thermosediminibacter oceani]|uniref:Phosphoesterase RecJ domain protein n=1 Tax=Thermosediminibacter oceani (strain ATCC BAA-1034 / DSM 16646 / JW/IW-1228P) TaxID=555079 RepID=D9S3L4_THEOJ|nr:bifunctional oligoribonuclease/PAP phosphatase NrnA [Thermosediminibacter oceani]ADL07991.1 phosphoesterase RecJ domain protein [Thermosediminibacter oceani DSM 16646]
MDFSMFKNLLTKYDSFIITSHVKPDGDALGSVLALTMALKKYGKKVLPIINDEVPKKYRFLPRCGDVRPFIPEVDKAEVMICLDSGDPERLEFKRDLRDICQLVVNIDHHRTNSMYGDMNLVDDSYSSVGEMVYFLLKALDISIDYDIAVCLYTSIITDTGSVKYSNTTPSCLRILAELVELGVKPEVISREVFEKKSLESVMLLKEVLGTLRVCEDGKLAYMTVTKNMMKTTGAKEEDIDGFINYAREIEGVEVAIIFKEQENLKVKVGLRANEWVDVSKIAEEFGGGGHARAAGCTIEGPMHKVQELVLASIKKYLKEGFR